MAVLINPKIKIYKWIYTILNNRISNFFLLFLKLIKISIFKLILIIIINYFQVLFKMGLLFKLEKYECIYLFNINYNVYSFIIIFNTKGFTVFKWLDN